MNPIPSLTLAHRGRDCNCFRFWSPDHRIIYDEGEFKISNRTITLISCCNSFRGAQESNSKTWQVFNNALLAKYGPHAGKTALQLAGIDIQRMVTQNQSLTLRTWQMLETFAKAAVASEAKSFKESTAPLPREYLEYVPKETLPVLVRQDSGETSPLHRAIIEDQIRTYSNAKIVNQEDTNRIINAVQKALKEDLHMTRNKTLCEIDESTLRAITLRSLRAAGYEVAPPDYLQENSPTYEESTSKVVSFQMRVVEVHTQRFPKPQQRVDEPCVVRV